MSHAIDAVLVFAKYQRNRHIIPGQPDLVPYRNASSSDSWGFCLAGWLREIPVFEAYRVHIAAELTQGLLSCGECLPPGESEAEVLAFIHNCHPSLASDNLPSIALSREFAPILTTRRRRLSWRFLFLPGTIGSLAWLAQKRGNVERIAHGLMLTCLGDGGPVSYKASRRGNAMTDRVAAHVLQHESPENRLLPFSPYGHDERQYSSPGFDLPIGCLMRSPSTTAPPTTSTSSGQSIWCAPSPRSPSSLRCSRRTAYWFRLRPMASRSSGAAAFARRLAAPAGGGRGGYGQMALLWTLNLADGRHSLFDMAEHAGLPFAEIRAATLAAEAAGLFAAVWS